MTEQPTTTPTTARAPRVLLDCSSLPANRAGVGRYLEGLIAGLAETDVDLVIAAQRRDAAELAGLAPRARIIPLPTALERRPVRLLWEQVGLPRLARSVGAVVIHSPHYTFPLLTRRARVVTLHDAIFFSDPGVHSRLKGVFFRTWTRLAWRHADAVVVPSVATGSELERFIGRPGSVPFVALHGVDTTIFSPPTPADVDAFRVRVGLAPGQRWIAFLGTIEPRKNLPGLLAAHADLVAELGTAAPVLLIAGGRGWDAEAARLLDALTPADAARELGYLPLDELGTLLGGAEAVVYPSFGEGFGLPVLEAMAAGAVVVTTRHLALPEVGGDAVLYVETDSAAIGAGIRRALSDTALAADLRERALARAATLSWASSARVHADAYRGAAGDPDGSGGAGPRR